MFCSSFIQENPTKLRSLIFLAMSYIIVSIWFYSQLLIIYWVLIRRTEEYDCKNIYCWSTALLNRVRKFTKKYFLSLIFYFLTFQLLIIQFFGSWAMKSKPFSCTSQKSFQQHERAEFNKFLQFAWKQLRICLFRELIVFIWVLLQFIENQYTSLVALSIYQKVCV